VRSERDLLYACIQETQESSRPSSPHSSLPNPQPPIPQPCTRFTLPTLPPPRLPSAAQKTPPTSKKEPKRSIHTLLKPLGIQAHIPRHQTALPSLLGINYAIPPPGRLHELGVLFLQNCKVLLGLPIPDAVGGEDEVHFFEGALVGFGVEGPDDDESGGVDGAEEVEGFFLEGGEDGWEEEDLGRGGFVSRCDGRGGGLVQEKCDLQSIRFRLTILQHPMRYLGHGLPGETVSIKLARTILGIHGWL